MITRFLPLIPLGLGIAIFVMYVHPTYTGPVAELQKEIHGYERALEAAEDFNERQTELVAARGSIAPDSLSRIEAFLPDGVDNVQLYLDLAALAARSGISLSDFDVIEGAPREAAGIPAPVEGAPSLERLGATESLDITVTAQGNYPSFRSFLVGVERSLRLLDVVSVSVTEAPNGGSAYSYDMTLRLYWLR